jgi:low temperature requirement protein LtrA
LILWAVSLAVELGAVFTTAYLPKLFVPLNIEHITERFGLFMLIILGEDIANIVFLENGQFEWRDYLVVFMALTQSFAFQLLYYDIEETHHHRKKHAFRRRKQTGQIWVILHLIYALSVPILAIGVNLLLDIVRTPGGAPVVAASHKRAVEPPVSEAPFEALPHAD